METTVEKLEAMFQKSEADLEYIERRLKLDFINNSAENGCPTEENPAVMLENLRAIKAKHTALCSQLKDIAAAQKESMDSIRINLISVMGLIQHFQQTTDVEVQTLTESEHESTEFLGSAISQTTTEVPPFVEMSGQQHPPNYVYEKPSKAMLEVVPLSIRSDIKLADLNVFYKELQQHFSKNNSGSLSVQKMKQFLQHLSVVQPERKGDFHLVI
ncbi:spindle and kinetochore-associated protein 2 isoform X2 [Scomber scombrus]|uniref:Protein FAM33A n=1 Tax=Scomber scombrus TaxID=13677 RepID=A0AAV1Q3Z9_SCOSC